MPNGYMFSRPKVERYRDENGRLVHDCRVEVRSIFTGEVAAECMATDVDAVDAERRAVDQAEAFMRTLAQQQDKRMSPSRSLARPQSSRNVRGTQRGTQ
jgi:hypothetical protein